MSTKRRTALRRRRWRILRFYAVGWTLAFIFLSIVRGVGTEEQGQLQFDFQSSVLISLALGPIMGLISGAAQIWVEERIYRHYTLGKLLLIRSLYAMGLMILLILLAYLVYQLFLGSDIGLYTFAVDKGSGAIYFYVLSVDIFLTVIRHLNLMLGEGNLRKILQGRFYAPHEEERIFMFLDLQGSTQLAEQLGHITYSRFIQDCFNDLGIVAEHEAEIYQYVGDEAVLTWPLKDGLKDENCLQAYFNFAALLRKRKAEYQKKYNCEPYFKAGMHSGVVTVTEVGKYKKEIAYHGDTINTAARIQGQCNVLESFLLVSEDLQKVLPKNGYNYIKKGEVALKGLKEAVNIYAVAEV